MAEKIPVYLICGFLDSGKTNFISPMLTGPDFTEDERTLLIVTEEGEEEYDLQGLGHYNVAMEIVESKEAFTTQACQAMHKKYRPTQVVVEYNGMWPLQDIQNVLPKNWVLYQIVATVDSTTFDAYSKNMSSLLMQQIGSADMVIFNRCTDALAETLRGRNLKMLNRRAEMYLEFTGDRMEEYDDGTPPFDLSLSELTLADEDYGVWYVDAMDNLDRYRGKIVKFRGKVAISPQFPQGTYACGRFAMVCCADDTTFLGMLCRGPEVKTLKNKQWAYITARVGVENLDIYHGPGPVLHTLEVTPCDPPSEELVYF